MAVDKAKQTVMEFADRFGGRFEEEEPADVFIDWEYWLETPNGQFMLIRFAEEYPNSSGEIVEQEPVLIVRCVNYQDDDPVPVSLMMVIEDDPNGFQRDVFEDTLEADYDTMELSFECEESSEYQRDRKSVTLRYSDERDVFTVLEDITAMG